MVALLALLLATPLTLRYDDADLGKVVADVAAQAEVKIALDDAFAGKRISLDVEDWQLAEVLEEIAKRAGGQVFQVPNGPFRIVPEWKHALLERLHETRVKLRIDDATPIASVLQSLRELTGVPVVVDPGRKNWHDLQLSVDQVTAAQLLDLITAPHELVWELRYGVVFVSTRARLAELPARLELAGVPDALVALKFDEASFADVARVLALLGGIEITGDLPETETVTLDVPAIGVHHALELLFVPRGLGVEMKNRKAVVSKRFLPTPCPEGFPELKQEAEAIDLARKVKSKKDLAALSTEAIERLDDTLNENFGNAVGAWCLYYLGEWHALRGERIDKQEREVALQYLQQVEESVKDPRLLAAARAARRRLEAAST